MKGQVDRIGEDGTFLDEIEFIFSTLLLICIVSEGEFLRQVMSAQNIRDLSAPFGIWQDMNMLEILP